jgi:hypothetical protein
VLRVKYLHRRPELVATGDLPWTQAKRVTAYLPEDVFELLRQTALDRGVGVGTVARELLEQEILRSAVHA